MQARIKRLEWFGEAFQLLLISAFIYRTMVFSSHDTQFAVRVIGHVGAVCFAYCLFTLYIRNRRVTGLVTSGLFRYTRHPMYSGLVLMDIAHWFTAWGTDFVISSIVFYSALIIAGLIQERETLTRFGSAAEAYYQRTPRLALFYPFARNS